MYDFNYVNIKSVYYHSSFVSLKLEWYITKTVTAFIITKRVKVGMGDYKNHIGPGDIITKSGENGIILF